MRDASRGVGGRSAWRVVGTGLLGGLFVYLVRYALAVLVPDLISAFQISAAEVGLLGSVYFWSYAPMQLPAGVLADTLGPRRSIAIFFVFAALGAFLFALAPNFTVVLCAAGLEGFGVSVGYVCTARLISSWFPRNMFGPLIGSWTGIGSLGSLIATVPLAWLVVQAGWRGSLGVLAAMLAVYALAASLLVRDAPAEAVRTSAGARPRLREAFAEVAGCRNTWLLGPYGFLSFGTMLVLQALWGVVYLIDSYGMSRAHASAVLSAWAVGLLVGAPGVGILADRVLRARKPVVLWGTLANAAVWLVLSLWPSGLPEPLLWIVFLFGGLTSAAWTASIAQFKDSVSPRIVGTAIGVFNFFFFLGGAILQPVSGVVLAAFPTSGGHISIAAYQALFRCGLASILVGGAFALFSREQKPL